MPGYSLSLQRHYKETSDGRKQEVRRVFKLVNNTEDFFCTRQWRYEDVHGLIHYLENLRSRYQTGQGWGKSGSKNASTDQRSKRRHQAHTLKWYMTEEHIISANPPEKFLKIPHSLFDEWCINNVFVLTIFENIIEDQIYNELWTNIPLTLLQECLFITWGEPCQNVLRTFPIRWVHTVHIHYQRLLHYSWFVDCIWKIA